jgi:predicted short-subunit dehydrogenase-like oxidoreductase (DUF2520 family)
MKIVLLGSGNVATHLGLALQGAGHEIIQVWSRDKEHAHELAARLNASALSDITQVSHKGDLYILAVKDDVIASIASQLSLTDQLIVHTSGSTGMNVLEGVSKRIGVVYPLQTFSKSKPVDFKIVPVVVEANKPEVVSELLNLAREISGKVIEMDSGKRQALHIAAVFACNFTNYLYTMSGNILAEERLDFDLLRPMIRETADKVQTFSPDRVQTGPAVRNDIETMKKHLQYLEKHPELYDLYEKLSQGIVNFHYKP